MSNDISKEGKNIKKYPFVKQEGIKECGVACLLMLIKYYNGYIDIQTLLSMTKTNKEGTTFYHLKNALIEIGFDAEGIKCSFEDVKLKKIPMPCICNITVNSSYKHFVVLYEVRKDYLLIADPAVGLKKFDFKSFEKIFNEAILIARPIKTIPYIALNNNYSFIKIILKNKSLFKLLIIYSVIITFLSIASSFYFGKLVDNIDIGNMLFNVFIIFFSINIAKISLEFFKNKIFIYISKRIDYNLTKSILNNIFSLPYQYYKNHTTGDIISRINDLSMIKNSLSKIIISIFIDIPLVAISLILLCKINHNLFLISLIILILNLLSIVIFQKINLKIINKLKSLNSDSTSTMVEAINAFEVVKGLAIKEIINNKVLNKYTKYLNSYSSFNNFIYNQDTVRNLINTIGLLILSYYGARMVFDNQLILSHLITFNTIYNYLSSSINSLIVGNIELNQLKISFKRINELIINKQEKGFLDYLENGNILFNNLSYTFNDKKDVLLNIKLLIRKKDKVLVIGKSGSGKSTLFKLLKGYYEVEMDKIFINNIDINNYKEKTLNDNILYLNQNDTLFNDTILNNIKMDLEINQRFNDITKICEIDDITSKTNLGYQLVIEEGGFNLSGGQRQRITLARALLREFKILIIDEALNQLDIKLERKILNNIFAYFPNKTIIVISHRIDNYDLFNRIVEMKEGKIIKNVIRKH